MRPAIARAVIGFLALSAIASGCARGARVSGGPSSASSAAPGSLLARRCSGCHATPDPASMTHQAWAGALERMKKRMRLSAGEWDSLAALSTAKAEP